MADYNIYIRAIGTGNINASNPTVPWSAREGGEGLSPTVSQSGSISGSGIYAASAITRAAGFMQNPDSIVGSAFNNVVKSLPWVAAAYAVVKLSESITDNVLEFSALETGNYGHQIQWQNFKTNINVVMHPISSTISSFKTQREWRRENIKLQSSRDLLGDSVINSYTNRGV